MAASTEKKERNGFSVISEKELLVVNGGQVSLPSYHVPQKEKRSIGRLGDSFYTRWKHNN